MESKDCAEDDDDVVCCICLEAIKVRDGRVLLISLGCCGKLHHLKCITEMLRRMQGVKKCPACNIKIDQSELSQLVPENLNINERFLQVNNRSIFGNALLDLDLDIETENRSINDETMMLHNIFTSEEIEDMYGPLWRALKYLRWYPSPIC